MTKSKFQMSRVTKVLAAAALMALAPAAFAGSTWTFNQGNVTSLPGSSGDPTVSLTGVYAVNGAKNEGFATGANWTVGNLSWFKNNGQGMYTGTDTGEPYHALDNNANTEAVLLNFGTTSVVLSEIALGYVSNGSSTASNVTVDISLFRWAGDSAVNPNLVGKDAASMVGWEYVGMYGNMVKDTSSPYNSVNSGSKGSSWWLISAYNSGYSSAGETRGTVDGGNDFFKLYAVKGAKCTSIVAEVCSPSTRVPEPGSLALMGAALIGFVGSRRRKQQAV